MADTKRKEWTIDSMRSAVQAVKDTEMGFLKAAKTFNVYLGGPRKKCQLRRATVFLNR
jgi:hypothetical protein